MPLYRFLENTSVENLYTAFLAGFADYQVDMRASLAEFEYRLLRDGVDRSLSAGAFLNDQLIGFTLNGKGLWQGQPTVYDAGTAVIPEHRGRGIATELFDFMVPHLKAGGFTQYLLEVLSSNESAAGLYRKIGFVDRRRFAVFRSNTRVTGPLTVSIREVLNPNWDLYKTFWSGYPSWQNSIDAVQRVIDTVVILEGHLDDSCVGYGIVAKSSGNLFQLAVGENYRRRGIGRALLFALQDRVSEDQRIKINNVDEDLRDAMAFFAAAGFDLVLEQHELSLTL
jgi:ribosomal protein S18 acetylase RimI-like enzyme